VLVNNAAIVDYTATVEQATRESYDRLFAINVRAPLFITQRVLPLMPDGGRIINVSSGVTWFAIPEIVYSMTKGALNVFTRSLAHTQGARRITVNTVSPGITETDMNSWLQGDPESQHRVANMTALGRHGQPADIADAVAFFASPDARWVTGQTPGSEWWPLARAHGQAVVASRLRTGSRAVRPRTYLFACPVRPWRKECVAVRLRCHSTI
jgi:3-oxoacyl-[acyl-carrier protein] reductase